MKDDITIFSDERHERWMQITKELYRRIFAEETPEAIYDWLIIQINSLQLSKNFTHVELFYTCHICTQVVYEKIFST